MEPTDTTPSETPTTPTPDELKALHARAEKAWLEAAILTADRGVRDGAETSAMLRALAETRR